MKKGTFIAAGVVVVLGFLLAAFASQGYVNSIIEPRAYFWIILSIGILSVALAALIVMQAIRELNGMRSEIVRLTGALKRGEYHARIHGAEHDQSALRDVAIALNAIAGEWETRSREIERKLARLDNILNTMLDPLVLVDDDGTVQFMNTAAHHVFAKITDPGQQPLSLTTLVDGDFLDKTMEQAKLFGDALTTKLPLMTRHGQRQFDVVAVQMKTVAAKRQTVVIFDDKTDAHRLETMRADFAANVTHELRSPLTSIRGFIETLKHTDPEDVEVRARFLDIIEIEAERLEQLISDVLILSEIESIKQENGTETFDVHAVIDDVLLLLDEKIRGRQLQVRILNDEAPVMVKANMSRIRQIIANLVDNAVKYTGVGSHVQVRAVRLDESHIEIAVRDNGDGIPAEHIDRLFERFYRVDKGRSREAGGTGLGLSIVKHIAQLYGGRASVESTPEQGTTFTVLLNL